MKESSIKLLIILFLPTFAINGFAQDQEADILTASQKRDGVYRTFTEFRSNNPSIAGKVDVGKNFFKVFNESTKKYEKVNGSFWGACKNDTIYIFLKETEGPQSPHIYPLQVIGRYCFFSEFGNAAYSLGGVTTMGTVTADYLLNINNGQIFKITKKVMGEVLSKDPALKKQFEAESYKEKVYKEYIVKVNQLRQADIKPISPN